MMFAYSKMGNLQEEEVHLRDTYFYFYYFYYLYNWKNIILLI